MCIDSTLQQVDGTTNFLMIIAKGLVDDMNSMNMKSSFPKK